VKSRQKSLPIGIDFGTTNSSLALAKDDAVELVHFSANSGNTESFRSVLYLEQHKKAGRRHVQSWTGPWAIEQYLDAEHKGRLIQSLKSYLPSRLLTGTEVLGRHYTLEDLISRMLADLRLHAERQFGVPVKEATVGRPVRFVGAETQEDEAYALARLRHAFELAGYERVEFEMEPVAAAYAYESTLDHDELIMIGDFGGGTSDFSLLHVGPGVRCFRRKDRAQAGFSGSGVGQHGAFGSEDSSCASSMDLREFGTLALPVISAYAGGDGSAERRTRTSHGAREDRIANDACRRRPGVPIASGRAAGEVRTLPKRAGGVLFSRRRVGAAHRRDPRGI